MSDAGPMSDAELPQLRASDADRERVVERLRQTAGEGRFDVEELDERLARAYAARTVSELEPLIANVVPAVEQLPSAGAGPVVPPGAPIIRVRMLAIMGGGEVRQGPKKPKRKRAKGSKRAELDG